MAKDGLIRESFARRIAKVVHYVEAMMREAMPLPKRKFLGRGDSGLMRYKLTEDLTYRSHAGGKKTTQNPETGAWTDAASEEVAEDIYDAILLSGQKIAGGSYVWVCRHHQSGLLNLVNSDNCAS